MNTFGNTFKISIFGESHGKCVGILIDGCPPGIELPDNDFITDVSRRRSGSYGTTPRQEEDIPKIMSGVFNDRTTGAPIMILSDNKDTISKDYTELINKPRPGHADFVAGRKYNGFNDYRGGGHFSGRLTLPLVFAGVLAKKIIDPVEVKSTLIEAGGSKDIDTAVSKALAAKDSIGGIIECVADNLPIGLGEPFFGSVESLISHIVFSIPAIKGIEFGSGFGASKQTGSNHNDLIINTDGTTKTNNAGGINGGLTNGNQLIFRVAVKPTSSIGLPQQTINLKSGKIEELTIQGRHDACIALRMPVIIEAAVACVLADFILTK